MIHYKTVKQSSCGFIGEDPKKVFDLTGLNEKADESRGDYLLDRTKDVLCCPNTESSVLQFIYWIFENDKKTQFIEIFKLAVERGIANAYWLTTGATPKSVSTEGEGRVERSHTTSRLSQNTTATRPV